uniref:Iron-sulfur cluster assembly accessory protein n=1 Tax=Eiseniibacteriota bacterium TaxID=2212470 RepID=A0A832MKQ9_UNCEI
MITVSETATRKLTEILAQQEQPAFGLRVHVFPGGCSGYSYGMSLAERAEEGDWVGEFNGVKVLVDPESAPLLEGATIDWMETVQAQGFTITNPNAVRSCGCGKSFETDEAAAHTGGGGCGCGGGGCGCGH